jgi:GAF domain-containing protein
MADEILQFVIKYCQCHQGSLFIYNETGGEQYLEMKACYAYHRKKHISKTIAVGNGLVGQCFLEKEIILLTEVPKDYVKITSGLGEATPAFLAIVPMKAKDNVMGIIEVASFERLEEHKVRFIEKASHAFASVIESVTTNQNIRHLLNESQQQAEELDGK